MGSQEGKVLFSATDIQKAILDLSVQINQDEWIDPIMVVILKGGLLFASDLAKGLWRRGMDLAFDFIWLSQYRESTTPNRNVFIHATPTQYLEGRDVLLVDDIADTGRSLKFGKEIITMYRPRLIRTCVLLNKPSKREVLIQPDYYGFEVGPEKDSTGTGPSLSR
jgi:hypoxanthine phosphoribosyltransferase